MNAKEITIMALYEYINIRTPVELYVEKRYAHMDDAFRKRKINSVYQNIEIAQAERSRLLDED